MDAKAAWVSRVLGIVVPGAPGPDSGSGELTNEMLRGELEARIKEMMGDIKLLPDRSAVPALEQLVIAAQTALQGGDLLAAEMAVDELEMAVAQARSKARVASAQNRKGLVDYRKAEVEWNRVRSVAREQLLEFGQMVKNDPDILDDPLSDEVLVLADQFTTLLPQFDTELEALLDELDTTVDENRRASLTKQALDKVREYRAMIADADGLAVLQSLAEDEYGGMTFLREMEAALAGIEKVLSV